MTVSVTPWAIDGATHPAAEARAMLCAQLSGTPGAWVTAVSAIDGAHGVANTTDFKVTQNGTPNMSVNVAVGAAFVRSGEAASQAYSVRNDATVNLSIAAADAVNARRDLVVLQVRDSNFSGADDDARLLIVQGTPAGSPADPSLVATPNALVLARIQVNASDTSIVTGDITDVRTGARGAPWFLPRGLMGLASTGSIQSGISGGTALTNMSSSITALANRRYKIYGKVNVRQRTAVAAVTFYIVRGGSTIDTSVVSLGIDNYGTLQAAVLDTPGAGAFTYALQLGTTGGTVETNSTGTGLTSLIIEDVGGFVA